MQTGIDNADPYIRYVVKARTPLASGLFFT